MTDQSKKSRNAQSERGQSAASDRGDREFQDSPGVQNTGSRKPDQPGEFLEMSPAGARVGIPVETEDDDLEAPPGEKMTAFSDASPRLDPDADGDPFADEVFAIDESAGNQATWMENTSYDMGTEVRTPSYRVNKGGRRTGGPTGGDFIGGGGGPAIGDTHEPDEEPEMKFGSREETQAALENKIAWQNEQKIRSKGLRGSE